MKIKQVPRIYLKNQPASQPLLSSEMKQSCFFLFVFFWLAKQFLNDGLNNLKYHITLRVHICGACYLKDTSSLHWRLKTLLPQCNNLFSISGSVNATMTSYFTFPVALIQTSSPISAHSLAFIRCRPVVTRSLVFKNLQLSNLKSLMRIHSSLTRLLLKHYNAVIMGTTGSQITNLTIVYSTVYSGSNQRKHQSSAALAFVRGIHRRPVNSPHKWPVTRKMFPFDDVIIKFWSMSHFLNFHVVCNIVLQSTVS